MGGHSKIGVLGEGGGVIQVNRSTGVGSMEGQEGKRARG